MTALPSPEADRLLAPPPAAAGRPGAQDIFGGLRASGGFDLARYRRLLGAAGEFKEDDAAIGVAAADAAERSLSRAVLGNTRPGGGNRDEDRRSGVQPRPYVRHA
jgi:hypothetical protein